MMVADEISSIFPPDLLDRSVDEMQDRRWWVLYTRSRQEKARARALIRRIEFRHTPKHGSWLNIAENELSSLTRQCVAGRRFGNIATLRRETALWSSNVNHTQRGVDWQMKISDARCKLKSVYPKIKL